MTTELKKLSNDIARLESHLWVVSWWVDEKEPEKTRFNIETYEHYTNSSLRRLVEGIDPAYELIAILESNESAHKVVDELTFCVS